MSSAAIDRSLIERLVRESVGRRLGSTNGNGHGTSPLAARPPRQAPAAPKLVVNVSARHAHVTQEDLERLFGKGEKLKVHKPLYQEGFFAAEQTVTLIGPRNRIITGLRILGPCRDHSQVELAFTDAIYLGLDVPVRKSGDHRDSPGGYLMGPAGMIKLERGIIRHERHVHMGASDTAYYGVKDGDRMNLRIRSDCGAVLEGLLVRESKGARLEVHIDTDEGNAVNLPKATGYELFK